MSSSNASSPTDRKAPAFTFSPTNSTGRSDLRVSISLDTRERAPVVDVDVEHGHSIHFAWPTSRTASSGSCEERDARDAGLPSISRPVALVPRAGGKPRRVPSPLDTASSGTATITTVADSYTQFGRPRVPRRSAYDVFTPKRPDSSLLGNVVGYLLNPRVYVYVLLTRLDALLQDELWDGSQSVNTTRAQTPSELIGMALTKDA